MEILNKVGRLSAQEMLEKIEKAALINYGLHRYPVKEYFSGNPGKRIVASLDNADTDHVLLEILRENPDKIFEGIEIAAELSGTSDKVLHIPDEETELMDSLKILAQKYDVALISGIVDVRIEQECIYPDCDGKDRNAYHLYVSIFILYPQRNWQMYFMTVIFPVFMFL